MDPVGAGRGRRGEARRGPPNRFLFSIVGCVCAWRGGAGLDEYHYGWPALLSCSARAPRPQAGPSRVPVLQRPICCGTRVAVRSPWCTPSGYSDLEAARPLLLGVLAGSAPVITRPSDGALWRCARGRDSAACLRAFLVAHALAHEPAPTAPPRRPRPAAKQHTHVE